MTVVWRSAEPTPSRVRYGTDPAHLDRLAGDAILATDHAVELRGLHPATQYHYRIQTPSGADAPILSFATPPEPGSRAPLLAWVVGDSGTGGRRQRQVRDAMLAYTADWLGRGPDIVLHLGDMAYSDGTDAQFTERFFTPYAALFAGAAVWPTLGNHEARTSRSAPQTGPYYQAFVLPKAGEAGGVASGTEAYYAFDHGRVHFSVLDSADSSLAPGSPMLEWLRHDLAQARPTSDWLIAYFHHPPYSLGSHNSQGAIDSGGRLRDMRENVVPILEAGGVDLVLAGHSHVYERSYPISGAHGYGSDPNFQTPEFHTLVADGRIRDLGDGDPTGSGAYRRRRDPRAGGTVYVVAGHGGASVKAMGEHPVMFFVDATHGSGLLRISGTQLELRNVRFDGTLTDRFAIERLP